MPSTNAKPLATCSNCSKLFRRSRRYRDRCHECVRVDRYAERIDDARRELATADIVGRADARASIRHLGDALLDAMLRRRKPWVLRSEVAAQCGVASYVVTRHLPRLTETGVFEDAVTRSGKAAVILVVSSPGDRASRRGPDGGRRVRGVSER